ncbi:hypothetical protein SapgrDRAFT_1658 [Saprospira grandis DSM 2844]|uniref:Uncharacterized protein n=1 Tax=Saprospira grandis DSM 2844 TaxID=694433 RepID=J0P0P9_9BACT|nr:hypothetical protein [Saprospira grandis]EJF53364.1 hypothetical protein SapgrDRAFT_1658 [Saprospira grandis DSM 2844]
MRYLTFISFLSFKLFRLYLNYVFLLFPMVILAQKSQIDAQVLGKEQVWQAQTQAKAGQVSLSLQSSRGKSWSFEGKNLAWRGLVAGPAGQVFGALQFQDSLWIKDSLLAQSAKQSLLIFGLDAAGNWLWGSSWLPKGSNKLYQLAQKGPYLYLSGSFNDSLLWQGQSLYGAGISQALWAKIATKTGKLLAWGAGPRSRESWGRSILPLGKQLIWAIEYRDSLMIDQQLLFNNPVHTDFLLLQLDSLGQRKKVWPWQGVYSDRPVLLLAHSKKADRFMVLGHFTGLLGPKSAPPLFKTAYKYYDYFWAELDTAGQIWSKGQSSSPSNIYVQAAYWGERGLFLGGYFQDSLQLADSTYLARGKPYSPYLVYYEGEQIEQVVLPWAEGRLLSILPQPKGLRLAGEAAGLAKRERAAWPAAKLPLLVQIDLIEEGPRVWRAAQPIDSWTLYNLRGQKVGAGEGAKIQLGPEIAAGVYSLHLQWGQNLAVERLEILEKR